MDELFEGLEMEGMSAEEQSRDAIVHVLQVIRSNPKVGYHLGLGTESFALLTEAAATLLGRKVRDVREQFLPRKEGK